jgi:Dolichyl-phosphate-mannose-protein mannosyltransferase
VRGRGDGKVESRSRINEVLTGVALMALCGALYVPPALSTPFFTKGEPREALVVREMVEDGHWILPTRASATGPAIASKPPFFHWLGAAASSLNGATTEWTVRLPSVVLGTATILIVWLIGRSVLPGRAALIGTLVLATTFEWLHAVTSARVDATLTALMTVALMVLYRGFVRDGVARAAAVGAYVCLACAALTKGPVGFVLPGLVLGVALLVSGRVREARRFHPALAALVILVIVVGWYAAASYLGGDAFVEKQIVKENVLRFVGTTRGSRGHAHPFYYYLPTLAAGFLPWTPFLVAALVVAGRSAEARRDPRVRFLLVWFAVVLVFYSLASAKRSVYLLALYPAGALLTGWWWDRLWDRARAPAALGGRATGAIVAVVGVVAAVPLVVAVGEILGLAPLELFGALLREKDRANLPIVAGVIRAHPASLVAAIGVVAGALVAALQAFRSGRWRAMFAANTTLAVALWVVVLGFFQPALAARRSLAPFFATVRREVAGAPLYFYPPTFDFSAAFYGPHGIGRWRPGAHGPGPHWVLIWTSDLEELPADTRAAFDVVATSAGTDPKGRRHMILARLTLGS